MELMKNKKEKKTRKQANMVEAVTDQEKPVNNKNGWLKSNKKLQK